MTKYRVSIQGDKWETSYDVEGSGWATAIARAIREWKKKLGKGSRTQSLVVRAIKVNLKNQE